MMVWNDGFAHHPITPSPHHPITPSFFPMLNLVPLSLYAVALGVYIWHFARRSVAIGRAATTVLVFAALSHTFVIGMLTVEYGHVPIVGPTSAISTFVWLLALAYL